MRNGVFVMGVLAGISCMTLAGCEADGDACLEYSNKGCTMEARVCPSGGSVGRVGPDCIFAPCEAPKSLQECDSKTSDFWKGWCIKDYAVANERPDLCPQAIYCSVQATCYEEIGSNPTSKATCLALPEGPRSWCLVTLSKTSSDASLCDLLTGEHQARCFYQVGANKQDSTLCDKAQGYKMGDYEMRYLCLRDIAKVSGDKGFCDRIKSEYPAAHYQSDCKKVLGL